MLEQATNQVMEGIKFVFGEEFTVKILLVYQQVWGFTMDSSDLQAMNLSDTVGKTKDSVSSLILDVEFGNFDSVLVMASLLAPD